MKVDREGRTWNERVPDAQERGPGVRELLQQQLVELALDCEHDPAHVRAEKEQPAVAAVLTHAGDQQSAGDAREGTAGLRI